MNDRNLFHKIGDFFTDHGLEFGRFFTTIIIAVVSILLGIDFNKSWLSWILWIILTVTIIISFVIEFNVYKKTKGISILEKECQEKSTRVQLLESTIEKIESVNYDLFQYVLISLYTKLNLDGHDRISVYRFKKDKFTIMSRYSINPEYSSINRIHYPISDGFIGLALQNGEYYIDNLPEFQIGQREKYYSAILNECKIDKEVLRKLKMRSRSFYCLALTDPTGKDRNAVIVFESTLPNKLQREKILEALDSEKHKIVAFVEKVRLRLPDIDTNFAKEKGF